MQLSRMTKTIRSAREWSAVRRKQLCRSLTPSASALRPAKAASEIYFISSKLTRECHDKILRLGPICIGL